ncbi:VCBS repeat-containing protein [Bacillus horti]|uniref:Spore coat protein n=1 Tax=Caldalkalibacillus horti TaxID=77523 RepID=A0ABT9W5F3_9BACI|nr:VCBS repeat-containing protein [Bacillus horti]MDQ0168466.1 hypothetical protein [Bacillus horti]
MSYFYRYQPYPDLTRNPSILPGGQWGDVNGDHIVDHVYLTGQPMPNSPYTENIQLHVQDGRTGMTYSIDLKDNAGYNPTIFLGDFTGDDAEDILVSIDSGGSGAFTYDELFSFLHNQARKLYDNDWFYEKYGQGMVNYEDFYKVRVLVPSLNKEYILDISGRDAEYLSQLYTTDGKLKKPTEGSISGVSGVYPIDLQRDGQYELWPFQRIIGLYNADGLGYLQTPLEWNKEQGLFVPVYQWASIYGNEIKAV